jgi:hypothetical protein
MYYEERVVMREGSSNDQKEICYKNFNLWVLTVTDSLF